LAPGWAGQLKMVELDVEVNPAVTARYMVLNAPTLILFKFGQEVERMTGIVSEKELRERVAPFLDT